MGWWVGGCVRLAAPCPSAARSSGHRHTCRLQSPAALPGALQVHSECETIRTNFRPVPLTWHFCHAAHSEDEVGGGARRGGGGLAAVPPQPAARLLPLLDEAGGRRINPALLPPSKRFGGDMDGLSDDDWGRWDKKGKVRAGLGWGVEVGGGCPSADACGENTREVCNVPCLDP